MNKTWLLLGAALLPALVACENEPAKDPKAQGPDGTKLLAEAFEREQVAFPDDAAESYLKAIERVKGADDPMSGAVATAALGSLALTTADWSRGLLPDHGLAFRTKKSWADALGKSVQNANNPSLRMLGARALTSMYAHRGNEELAEKWRVASGCVREALVFPPRDWAAALAVTAAPTVSSAPGTQIRFNDIGIWKTGLEAHVFEKRGCLIRPRFVHAAPGVRDVVFDRRIDKAGWVDVAITARPPFALRAGGKDVAIDATEGDQGTHTYVARLKVSAGRLRFVATVGGLSFDPLEVAVVPRMKEVTKGGILPPPTPADSATASVDEVHAYDPPAAKSDDERLASSLAAITLGNARLAEQMLMLAPRSPALAIALERALFDAHDLPQAVRSERVRGAIADLADARWKDAWEPRWALASLAGDRKGSSESTFEVLAEIDRVPPPTSESSRVMMDLLVVHAASAARLPIRASEAYARAKPTFDGTEAGYHAEMAITQRSGADRVELSCGGSTTHDMSVFDCAGALLASGRYADAMLELARLRRVRGAPDEYLGVELRNALAHGDGKTASALVARALPGELSLGNFRDTERLQGGTGKTTPRELLGMPDVPDVLFHEGGDNTFAPYQAALTKALEAAKADNGGGTRIIDHDVKVTIEPNGILHYVLFDVRKVAGTGDVEGGAEAGELTIGAARVAERVLRRNIHKPDGRVLLPDRSQRASQGHADLSQLEPGDVIEALYEGWAIPATQGALSFATADLLPERTSVQHATISVSYPSKLGARLYAHPILGKAREHDDGITATRVWTVEKQAPRRLESGVPYAENAVALTWSVDSYPNMARALQENLQRALQPDSEVTAVVREATKNAKDDNDRVASLVTLAGERIKESVVGDLLPGFISGTASFGNTLRYALATHEGSRSALVARGLLELGIKCDVVLAEPIPFPTAASFPAGPFRFTRPLVVAHLPAGDVWLDTDVPGSPLPAGRISSELEGRFALTPRGEIIRVPAGTGAERDEIDLRLTVDAKGDAAGSLTVLLRGRTAQTLSEAFTHLVGSERESALRTVALAWVPNASVDTVQLSSREGSWEIALRADVTIRSYAQLEKTPKGAVWTAPGLMPMRSMIPKPSSWTLSSAYASKAGRENALVIQRAQRYRMRRHIDFPEGSTVTRVPGPLSVEGPLSANRKTEVKGRSVNDEFSLSLSTTTIDKNSYDAFARELRRVDEAFLAETRVTPGK